MVGAGWAGLAAAVALTQAGHTVSVFEASRSLGGRARVAFTHHGQPLDNGQHILVGAYSHTLALMRELGVDIDKALLRIPMTLLYPDGGGLLLPDWKQAWWSGLVKGADVAAGILRAKGWTWRDKLSLLRAADAWRRSGFKCAANANVHTLCKGISPRVMQDMVEPLVVSALNTPPERASAQVFLTVMRDALFAPAVGGIAGSNMLLPRVDLGALLPDAAAVLLAVKGGALHTGSRVESLRFSEQGMTISRRHFAKNLQNTDNLAHSEPANFDAVVLATPAWETARILRDACKPALGASIDPATASEVDAWCASAESLQHEAITTVYAYAEGARLPSPMLALRSSAKQPAQFVFDRGQLTGQAGLLAFVVSASTGTAQAIESQVIAQGRTELGLKNLQAVKTIVEKRATFACTPALQRPGVQIAPRTQPRLLACGDYTAGPYPATLEAAVRSGQLAALTCIAQLR